LKFFTRGWVNGDTTGEAADAVVPAYSRHLDGLALPQPVMDLASLNPHDAHVLDVEHEPVSRTLRLRLRCGDLQSGYSDVSLTFSGAMLRAADAATLARARRPADFEILYDEVDRADAGAFEYRLLLHPVGEVAFRFSDVTVVRKPVADRRAV
jgi:hypothetical protein